MGRGHGQVQVQDHRRGLWVSLEDSEALGMSSCGERTWGPRLRSEIIHATAKNRSLAAPPFPPKKETKQIRLRTEQEEFEMESRLKRCQTRSTFLWTSIEMRTQCRDQGTLGSKAPCPSGSKRTILLKLGLRSSAFMSPRKISDNVSGAMSIFCTGDELCK